MHGLESVFLGLILLATAQMHFCKVAMANTSSDCELVLEIKHDNMMLKDLHPVFAHLDRIDIEFNSVALRHHYDPVEVSQVSILKPMPLDSAVLDVQLPSWHLISITCVTSELI